ncbi:MAG: hypothetical protein Q4G25_06315 [Paracoccus sp. (in: a-proteobacteria)]|nr:hypothetical protein [Paracoccus sp. (in: a-proteobacteria)]
MSEASSITVSADGLMRAQAQLAGLVPPENRLMLARRAWAMDPSARRLRQLAAACADCGDAGGAAAALAGLPEFIWQDGAPDGSAWRALRAQLAAAGVAVPAPSSPAGRLVISFTFPPFVATAGTVMARRIETDGRRADVISNDMSGRTGLDPALYAAIRPLIGHHLLLDCENDPARPAAVTDFADKAARAVGAPGFGRPAYDEVWSRSMWVQSHFAAAALVVAGKAASWVAEFSDPCRRNLDGQEARTPGDDDWLERSGIAGLLHARGFAVPAGRSLMFWAEYLPFCLADRLIFTNEAQRDLMLSQDDPPDIIARAAARAEVIPHPVPGPLLLSAMPMPEPLRGPLLLGYFGSANPRRGLGRLLEAMAAMPATLRSRIELHVHGAPDPALRPEVARLGLEGCVRLGAPLGYLAALARMRMMDWLFLNDTARGEGFAVNPYLPSKLSDYRSAARPLLVHADPGSSLDSADLPPGSLRARTDDPDALTQAICRIAAAGAGDPCSLQSRQAGGNPPGETQEGAPI